MCVESKAKTTHRLIWRGFLDGVIVQQSEMTLNDCDIEEVAFMLALEHIELIATRKINMIEVEFPDDPEEERYFRVGVVSTGMIVPVKVLL